jgi:hypothetical protein
MGATSLSAGAIFGSGAFTTIEADRSVELDVKSDAKARIGFEKNGDGAGQIVKTTEGDNSAASIIKFTQADLNEQAKTSFLKALTITNNGTGDSAPDVNLYVKDGELLGGEWDSGDDNGETIDDILDFRENGGDSIVGNSIELKAGTDQDNPGDSVNIDVVVNLRNGGDEEALEGIEKVTFVAEAIDD